MGEGCAHTAGSRAQQYRAIKPAQKPSHAHAHRRNSRSCTDTMERKRGCEWWLCVHSLLPGRIMTIYASLQAAPSQPTPSALTPANTTQATTVSQNTSQHRRGNTVGQHTTSKQRRGSNVSKQRRGSNVSQQRQCKNFSQPALSKRRDSQHTTGQHCQA